MTANVLWGTNWFKFNYNVDVEWRIGRAHAFGSILHPNPGWHFLGNSHLPSFRQRIISKNDVSYFFQFVKRVNHV
jgi:hypothetical protein